MPDNWMLPLVRLATFINLDAFLLTSLGKPHLLSSNLEVLCVVPLPTVDRCQDRQVYQRHAEEFQQIESQGVCLRTRLMIKAQGWIKPDHENSIHHILQQQGIAERQQGITTIPRRTTV